MLQDTNPPDADLTMKQFADSVRQKYPDVKMYKEKSDFDLSKAVIDSNPKYKIYQQRIKDWPAEQTQWPITPKEGESFQDTIKRGISAGKSDKLAQDVAHDPVKRAEYFNKSLKEAPWGKAAATYGAMVAIPFALAEIGKTLGAPFSKKVVRDALTGRMKSVPSTVSKIMEHLKQPGTIVKTPYGRAIEYALLSKAGLSRSQISRLIGIIDK